MQNEHGGKREGAGRPSGSRNIRAANIIDFLDNEENNPVVMLAEIMKSSKTNGDNRLAADCAKALLPYYAAKLKPLDEEEVDTHRPIQVHVQFPLPGDHWRTGKPVPQEVEDYLDGNGPYPYANSENQDDT